MKVVPFFYCKCGKMHTANFVVHTTVCKCGERLMPQIPVISTNATKELN